MSTRAAGRTERFKEVKLDGEQLKLDGPADLAKYLDQRDIPQELRRHYRLVDGKLEEDMLPNNAAENNASAQGR